MLFAAPSAKASTHPSKFIRFVSILKERLPPWEPLFYEPIASMPKVKDLQMNEGRSEADGSKQIMGRSVYPTTLKTALR